MIKTVVTVKGVEDKTTKAGKPFGVVLASDGKDYSSWADALTSKARSFINQTVEIGYEETQRGSFTNRNLKFIELAGGNVDIGDSSPPNGETASPVSNGEGAVAYGGEPGQGGWLGVVQAAASRGEWRAAEALLRRQDINRSVAINNTIQFFGYLKEEDRTPSNVGIIFDHILQVLNGDS